MIHIVGAGLAGMLAGNMLIRRQPILFEQQSELPNNHSAVLRFRSSLVSEALGIPFKQVTMVKATAPWLNPIADTLAYSFKNTGTYRSDRSINAGSVTAQRYVAPPDLVQRMATPLEIRHNHNYSFISNNRCPVISTIPMPALMDILEFPNKPKFIHQAGVNVHAKLQDCDAYVSLVVPDPEHPISRISITGDDVIVECYEEKWQHDASYIVRLAAEELGITPQHFTDAVAHRQRYAKIAPIDDRLRHDFMYWATDKHNIFSLGRFATWRPSVLMDDLVQDVRKIGRWIDQRYDMNKSR